jgi:antitoxin (DNA-binding transcriptional repressor) of toxin-antitoxin stability system
MSRASLQSTVDLPAAVLAPESGGDSAIEGTEQQNVTQDSLEDAASPLLLGITPLAGPNNGGTSLTVSLGAQQQAAGDHRWQLSMGSLATLNCTVGGEAALRCCCAPPSNVSRVALKLLRCEAGGACERAAAPQMMEHGHFEFQYYHDPQLVRVSPDRGQVGLGLSLPRRRHPPAAAAQPALTPARTLAAAQVSGGQRITITARGWPSADVVGHQASRCRFGSMRARRRRAWSRPAAAWWLVRLAPLHRDSWATQIMPAWSGLASSPFLHF